MTRSFDTAAAAVRPLDQAAMADATARQARLTKPSGALGQLEAIGIQLAGMAGCCPPPLPTPAAVGIFAGDHGVLAEGVTPWPMEVTGQMAANFIAGGAAINVLARQVGARVVVVDVGMASDLETLGLASEPGPEPGLASEPGPESIVASEPWLRRRRVRAGTANLAVTAAMTADEARQALDVGADTAAELIAAGARCLVTGEMGIGNTTPAAAVIAALTGAPAAQVTGRGTGIDDPTLARKVAVIERALDLHADALRGGPLSVVAAVGGLEIAALAGFIVGAAAARVPVVIDGVIADAALLVAAALVPDVVGFCIAGHRSVEPGATAALAYLGLVPLLDLGLRLGEGSGACLALPIVEASARILGEMATFDSAGVTDKG